MSWNINVVKVLIEREFQISDTYYYRLKKNQNANSRELERIEIRTQTREIGHIYTPGIIKRNQNANSRDRTHIDKQE